MNWRVGKKRIRVREGFQSLSHLETSKFTTKKEEELGGERHEHEFSTCTVEVLGHQQKTSVLSQRINFLFSLAQMSVFGGKKGK